MIAVEESVVFGGEDPCITDNVPELAREMERAGKSFEYYVYPGAPHAFFNDTRPQLPARGGKGRLGEGALLLQKAP